jgi:hypothetical protein
LIADPAERLSAAFFGTSNLTLDFLGVQAPLSNAPPRIGMSTPCIP